MSQTLWNGITGTTSAVSGYLASFISNTPDTPATPDTPILTKMLISRAREQLRDNGILLTQANVQAMVSDQHLNARGYRGLTQRLQSLRAGWGPLTGRPAATPGRLEEPGGFAEEIPFMGADEIEDAFRDRINVIIAAVHVRASDHNFLKDVRERIIKMRKEHNEGGNPDYANVASADARNAARQRYFDTSAEVTRWADSATSDVLSSTDYVNAVRKYRIAHSGVLNALRRGIQDTIPHEGVKATEDLEKVEKRLDGAVSTFADARDALIEMWEQLSYMQNIIENSFEDKMRAALKSEQEYGSNRLAHNAYKGNLTNAVVNTTFSAVTGTVNTGTLSAIRGHLIG